jgi:hypothetical protein
MLEISSPRGGFHFHCLCRVFRKHEHLFNGVQVLLFILGVEYVDNKRVLEQ